MYFLPLATSLLLNSGTWEGDVPQRIVAISAPGEDTATEVMREAIASVLRTERQSWVVTAGDRRGAPSKASKAITRAEKFTQSARAKFQELELPTCQKLLGRSIRLYERNAQAIGNLHHYKEALSLLGATHLLLGQERKGRKVIERLARIDIDWKPRESTYNPEMLSVYDAVISRVRGSATLSFNVEATPSDALIRVDDRLVGIGSAELSSLPSGKHLVHVSRAGFVTQSKFVTLKGTELGGTPVRLTLEPELRPSDARFQQDDWASFERLARSFESMKPDAAVFIGGTPRQATLASIQTTARAEQTFNEYVSDFGLAISEASAVVERWFNPIPEAATLSGTPKPSDPTASGNSSNQDPEPIVTTQASPSEGGLTTGTLVFYIVAVAAGGAGAYFALQAQSASDEYSRGTPADTAFPDAVTDQVEGQAIADAGQRDALIADILFGAAALSGLIGIIKHVSGGSDRDDGEEDTVTLGISPTSATVGVRF